MTQKVKPNEELSPDAWRANWLERCYDVMTSPIVVVEYDDCYNKWLKNIPSFWDKTVYRFYLEEVTKYIKIKKGAEYCADIKVGSYYLLLVQQEYSKIYILENQAVFNNIVWIVNVANISPKSIEQLSPGSIKNSEIYTSLDDYAAYLERRLSIIPTQRANAIKSGNKSQVDFYKKKMQNLIDSLDEEHKTILSHIYELKVNSAKYKHYFNEDWGICSFFPFDNCLKRFKYTASPLFLDMGTFMYYRKYFYNPFTGSRHEYFKQITYAAFMNWLITS